MDQQTEHISKRRVVYRMPGVEAVRVRRDVEYRTTDAGALKMDLYYPPDADSATRTPAVIIVAGFPDPGFEARLGCKFKEMGSSVSWAQLMAASGLVAITYTNLEPAADIESLLEYVRRNGPTLGIDGDRLGLWASSGNAPLALSVLMREGRQYLKCAVICYGFMPDPEGPGIVAEAARAWGFVNPCAGKSFDELPRAVPLFIVRAGQDQIPRLNETIDRFLHEALIRNLPITLVNHPDAPHAFDLFDDGETSREVIRQILAFAQFHLLPQR